MSFLGTRKAMMNMTNNVGFRKFFKMATCFDPFPYQSAMAMADKLPTLLSIPTGLGKTAAIVLAWVWRRRQAADEVQKHTPRRLVYCLPMRVLVEQTYNLAREWLSRLDLLAGDAPASHPAGKVAVHMLMGGDLERDWDHWPDRDQILIGTQDMLLSRALNRGYAVSRFRWPLQFGLLNNDCLWVMDEVQLMGSGLSTTTQLQAFRRKMETMGKTCSLWMSATMRSQWLDTVDFDLNSDVAAEFSLLPEDRKHAVAMKRLGSSKPLSMAPKPLSKDGKTEARLILDAHQKAGGLTLVVVNTVKRARAIYSALLKSKTDVDLVLVHSRFRPGDRKKVVDRLLAEPGRAGTIAVSTQVVEAGVDVSAKTLFSDLAPWASLVQRFGRCNRKGEYDSAPVIWFDIQTDKQGSAAPYTEGELNHARERLKKLGDVSPNSLPEVDQGISFSHVIRRRDIVDLFDTTPDLAGADIDVSRLIREADEHSAQIFWRDFEGTSPESTEPHPHRDELCSVPLGELRDFMGGKKKKKTLWRWDHLERGWIPVRDVFPGLTLMAKGEYGGYGPGIGWSPKEKQAVKAVVAPPVPSDSNDADFNSESTWQTLAEHTNAVVAELENLIKDVPALEPEWIEELRLAARWHDAGKAHRNLSMKMRHIAWRN
jgi:CRISPR-associated endonuclease/helicase Cas3